MIQDDLMQSQQVFAEANRKFLEADAKYEKSKTLMKCKTEQLVSMAEGSSQTEKRSNVEASDYYREMVTKLSDIYLERNIARAEKEGAETAFEAVRSVLSYEKALIDKGIYSPTTK